MDEFIAEIHKRNILWNKKNPRYKDRLAVDKEWDIVAERTGFTKVEAKKKWRNLRDQFSKEMKKNPKPCSDNPRDGFAQYAGKWQYFASLMFLKDIVTQRATERNVQFKDSQHSTATNGVSESEDENSEDNSTTIRSAAVSSQPNTPGDILRTSLNKPRRANPSKAKSPCRKRKCEGNIDMEEHLSEIEARNLALFEALEDENSLFLRSLLPYMKRMNPLQQLRVRSKFQEILIQEMSLAQCSTFPFFNTYCPVSPPTPSNYSSIFSPSSPADSS